MKDGKDARQAPYWSAPLTLQETRRFLAVCEQQGHVPGEVVRSLIGLYVEADGAIPDGPKDLDRTLIAFLDWCVEGVADAAPPETPQPRSSRRRKSDGQGDCGG